MKPCFLMVARWFALCLFGLESSVALAAEDYMAEALAASRRAPLQIAAYQKEVNQAVKDSTRETQKEAEDEKDIKETKEIKKMPAILIFVSFSMPEQSLEAFLRDAKKVHASVVIRGLVNNSFQQTLQRMKKLIQASGGNGVELNPLWFKRLGIQRVPTVAVVPPESVCLTQMREITDSVDSDYLRPIFRDYYLRLQRGKHLEQFQIFPSLYYFPIDGSQFYGSKEIHCEQCLVKEHQNGSKSYSHQVLQGGIAHPDCSQVIPFMPEQIVNTDGANKQDCEMNAAKRLVEKLHQAFPQLGLLLGGDALFSKQPIIEDVLRHHMHYLFAAKPDDHKYMMECLNGYIKLNNIEFTDEQGRLHYYEWINKIPLNGNKDTINVNFLRCTITGKNKKGEEDILYKNSWITDLPISEKNIKTLVKAGRCRWKSENEIFNVMKNQGYCMEHNYGHGQKNMAFNFYLLTLLAFFMHQIFELTDRQYQACRTKLGSKKHLWETIRSYIKIIIYDSWERLLEFVLTPTSYRLSPLGSSP